MTPKLTFQSANMGGLRVLSPLQNSKYLLFIIEQYLLQIAPPCGFSCDPLQQ